MDKFNLKHVVLYAKNWYKRDNIWKDLQILLDADGYNTMWRKEPHISDIVRLIISQCMRLEVCWIDTYEFFDGIKDSNVWKNGYYTNTNCGIIVEDKAKYPDYNIDEAAVRYCLSNLCSTEIAAFTEGLCKPNFDLIPKVSSITDKKVEEVFGHLTN